MSRRRIRDRARREAQSVEQRQILLQRRLERLNAESGEQRDVKLQQMRELTRDRRVAKSSEQRAARLQQVSLREEMRDYLADESVEHERGQATTDERADEG